jgi:acetyltransferase AlgX (SGNH hydrolase-like protein)
VIEVIRRLRGPAAATLVVGAVMLGLSLTTTHRAPAPKYDGNPKLTLYRPDPATIWRHAPNTQLHYIAQEFTVDFRLDGDGLRGPDELPASTVPTVLFIGDSFTFGWGVSARESFVELIRQQLAASSTAQLRFVNAGVNSFAFDQQLLMLKRLIAAQRPVLVVQGLYWPHIRSLFGHRETLGPDGRLMAVSDPSIKVDDQGVLWNLRGANQAAGDWISYFRADSAHEQLWQRTERLLGETRDVVAAANALYLPFLIPTNVEVGGANWGALGWPGATPPADVDLSLPLSRLASLFRSRGIDFVDLSPHLREPRVASQSHYYPHDGHWSAAGQAAAAEVLASYVENLVLRQAGRP